MSESSEIAILFSGELGRDDALDPMTHWATFIELQKQLPVGYSIGPILGHSWGQNHRQILHRTYSPTKLELDNKQIDPSIYEISTNGVGIDDRLKATVTLYSREQFLELKSSNFL